MDPSTQSLDPAVSNRLRAAEDLTHLEALGKNPDFAWFVANFLEKARDDYREKALSTKIPAEQAEQARWQHDALRTLCGEFSRRLKAAEEGLAESR